MTYQVYDDTAWQQESQEVWDRWDGYSNGAPQQTERFEVIRETTRQQAFSGVSWLLDIIVPNCG